PPGGARFAEIAIAQGGSTLGGTNGNDVLIANAPNSTLTGWLGDDIFRVERGSGHTVITDFGSGHDLLDISAFTGAGYAPTIATQGRDTLLSFANGDSITLAGVSSAHLANGARAGTFAFA
ncbi:MAG: hypothetical protein ACRCSO_07245, partial [Sphingomonas sp.]